MLTPQRRRSRHETSQLSAKLPRDCAISTKLPHQVEGERSTIPYFEIGLDTEPEFKITGSPRRLHHDPLNLHI